MKAEKPVSGQRSASGVSGGSGKGSHLAEAQAAILANQMWL